MPCHFGIASRNPLWAPRIQTYLRILPHRLEAAGRDMQPPCDNQINKPGEQQCAGDQRAKAGVDEGRCCKRDDAEKTDGFGQAVSRGSAVGAHRRFDVTVRGGRCGNFIGCHGAAAPDALLGELVAVTFDHHILPAAINTGNARQNQDFPDPMDSLSEPLHVDYDNIYIKSLELLS